MIGNKSVLYYEIQYALRELTGISVTKCVRYFCIIALTRDSQAASGKSSQLAFGRIEAKAITRWLPHSEVRIRRRIGNPKGAAPASIAIHVGPT